MKYYSHFFTNFQINITTPMTRSSLFTTYMTMISDLIIINNNQFTKNLTNIRPFKFFILLSSHDQVFAEMLFDHISTIIIFFEIALNNFKNCIFLSMQHNIFTKFIVNTDKFISKTTKNVILIFLGIRRTIVIKPTINTF